MASTVGGDYGLRIHMPASAPAPFKPPPPPHGRHNARRRVCACSCLLATLLTAATLLVALSLTILRVRAPTTRLVSTHLAGVAPRVYLRPGGRTSVRLNVTLLLTVAVHNPNRASFAFATGGRADLCYRGDNVAEASVDPGRVVPSRGDGEAALALTVRADRLAAHAVHLVADVERGAVEVEASVRIPGRIAVLGVFKHDVVAYSECSFVFDVVGMRVRSHQCTGHTKL